MLWEPLTIVVLLLTLRLSNGASPNTGYLKRAILCHASNSSGGCCTDRNFCAKTPTLVRGGSSISRRGGVTSRSSNPSTSSNIHRDGNDSINASSLKQGFRRTACSLYIWNAPSALLFRWCHHLQRDCVYEGLGGKKFVRIQPGSMLQLLYPCSRYSLDKCVLCGGTFRDHLILWWSKHMYTPYDRYLDQVYQESMVTPTVDVRRKGPLSNKKLSNDKCIASVNNSSDRRVFDFGYHRRYVLDITALFNGLQKPRDNARILLRSIQQRYDQPALGSIPSKVHDLEQRKWPRFSNQPKIRYIVPCSSMIENGNHDNHNNTKVKNSDASATTTNQRRSRTTTFILWLGRDLCLEAIDRLLDLQQIDRMKKYPK